MTIIRSIASVISTADATKIVVQCIIVTWGTNISINYGNEYFDWNMDRPEQVAAIRRAIEGREGKGSREMEAQKTGSSCISRSPSPVADQGSKIMGHTTRIIHDGTFPPWVALLISVAVQAAVLIMAICSRYAATDMNCRTPFRGVAVYIALIASFLSHQYVGPPLRLHYNGFGEIISSFLVSPLAVVWGMAGYYTATNPFGNTVALSLSPSILSFGIDQTVWLMLLAMYCTELARILIMHIHDIQADTAGGKITLVVRIGYVWTMRAYMGLNIAGVVLWGCLIDRVLQGKGGLLGEDSLMGGKMWAWGIGIVLSFSIPIMVLTAVSLYVNRPDRALGLGDFKSIVPIIPKGELGKIVSLQMLLTPLVLSVVAMLAG